MLHVNQARLFVGHWELVTQTAPNPDALTLFVVLIVTRICLATHAALIKEVEQNVVCGTRIIGITQRLFRGFGDLHAKVDRGFIVQLKWANREAKLTRGIVHECGFNTFANHADTLVDVGNDASVRVEEARVIHNDGRLADLAHIVERFGHRAVARFGTFDDFHQPHFLNG